MSAPMRRHPISRAPPLKVVHAGEIYQFPISVAKCYRIGSVLDLLSEDDDRAVLADDLLCHVDEKYGKPGALLKGLRHREGLTHVDFAKKVKITQSDLSKMERGQRPVGKILAERIGKKFKISPKIFMG